MGLGLQTSLVQDNSPVIKEENGKGSNYKIRSW